MVVAITQKQWSGLVKSLRLEERIAQIESAQGVSFEKDEGQRFLHRDALFPLFEQAIAAQQLTELRERFEAHGVCWSPYLNLSRALKEDPRLSLASSLFTEIDQPSGSRYPAPGQLPPSMAATVSRLPRASPGRAHG
jgi:2-methylfumaryl-CoA isomerase